MEPEVRRTRRGAEAAAAALEELEIRSRIDEPDPSASEAGDYDLAWVRERLGADTGRAAAADVYTPDEAMERVAGELDRDYPLDDLDDLER